jgi:hypothetical protein
MCDARATELQLTYTYTEEQLTVLKDSTTGTSNYRRAAFNVLSSNRDDHARIRAFFSSMVNGG